ncbi:uncharacterized protein ANIA_11452 [Aspergillus nidulans FGSC A4]|uniref:Uncharacterized protein n=1 Tax=Emericella nidulans (strain FGSC A4 / ATCC 38163 / CBS 112.46 / NRRL 194 / M139) TaxID=227321 RepID=C8V9D6_EMENI|nr:hypothetical protein [Aspergillus nidulans FGSC A4]CBF76455.1 TPA: hypothetical protein ANIA_11452 [Aspergillus nidulans FGSC A4]
MASTFSEIPKSSGGAADITIAGEIGTAPYKPDLKQGSVRRRPYNQPETDGFKLAESQPPGSTLVMPEINEPTSIQKRLGTGSPDF